MLSQGINIWGGEQFAPLFGVIKRFFTEIQSSLSQHYTIPTVTLAGDFEIEFDYAGSGTSGQPFLTATDQTRVARLTTGGVVQAYAGSTSITSLISVTDGLLHTINMKRESTTLTLTIDGTPVSNTTTAFNGTSVIDLVAMRGTTFLDGILANLKITDGTTLTHDLPFDEDFGTTSIAVNKGSIGAAGNATAVNITSSELFTPVGADWLGEELWTQGDYVSTGSEGTFQFVSDELGVLTTGNTYRSQTTVTNMTSSQFRLRTGATNDINGITMNADGEYTADRVADGATSIRLLTGTNQPNAGATVSVSTKRLIEVAT